MCCSVCNLYSSRNVVFVNVRMCVRLGCLFNVCVMLSIFVRISSVFVIV